MKHPKKVDPYPRYDYSLWNIHAADGTIIDTRMVKMTFGNKHCPGCVIPCGAYKEWKAWKPDVVYVQPRWDPEFRDWLPFASPSHMHGLPVIRLQPGEEPPRRPGPQCTGHNPDRFPIWYPATEESGCPRP